MASPTTVPRSSGFFDHDCLLVTVQKEGQDKGEEKEDCVHDPQGPRRFQHGTVLVQVGRPRRTADPAIVPERTEIDVDGPAGKIAAARTADAAKLIVCSDESADKEEIDECDEEGRATGRAETDEGR